MKVKLLYLLLFVFLIYGHKTMSQNNTLKKDSIKEKTNFREFKDKTIFEDDTLNGKIKTIIQNTYGENFDNSDVIYTFDEFGSKVRRQGYGQDIFEYYKGNKLIKTSICDADNGEEYSRYEYLYDERGNLIKRMNIVDLPKDKYTTIILYFYSNDDKIIEIRDLIETIKYQYDELNDCIIEERYDEDVLRERIENKYINHRIVEKVTWRLFEGEEYYVKEIYNYNLNGTLKSITYYYSRTKELPKENDGIKYFYYTHDKKNRLVKFQAIQKKYYKETIIYSNFDENGNWQLKKINQNGRKKKIKRRFEYYDN